MNQVESGPGGDVGRAYAARAQEYVNLFGSIDSAHASDRELVRSWTAGLTGPVLDVGCGPGQWTDFLASCGVAAHGVDLVEEFIARARQMYPILQFDRGSCEALAEETDSLGGVLAWYSLIHHDPDTIHSSLSELARVLRPGGGLLIGFFVGETVEPFAHAVTAAYRWPVAEMSRQLALAGFDVIETHTRTGPGQRPHGAITARSLGAN